MGGLEISNSPRLHGFDRRWWQRVGDSSTRVIVGDLLEKIEVVPAEVSPGSVASYWDGFLGRPEEDHCEVRTQDHSAANCTSGCSFSVIVLLSKQARSSLFRFRVEVPRAIAIEPSVALLENSLWRYPVAVGLH